MSVPREDIDFFFDNFIKVSAGNQDSTVWAVGSYKGDAIMIVTKKEIDALTMDDMAKKRVFVTLKDLTKVSPYRQYDIEAIARAEKLAKVRDSAPMTS